MARRPSLPDAFRSGIPVEAGVEADPVDVMCPADQR
jgi:hypothetical protein